MRICCRNTEAKEEDDGKIEIIAQIAEIKEIIFDFYRFCCSYRKYEESVVLQDPDF
jgi:hypothetical protein